MLLLDSAMLLLDSAMLLLDSAMLLLDSAVFLVDSAVFAVKRWSLRLAYASCGPEYVLGFLGNAIALQRRARRVDE
jgi:hypothetical protein